MPKETAFTMDTSSIKFGAGVTREVGQDMVRLGSTRVMVVTDPRLSSSPSVETAMTALKEAGLDAVLYDQSRVEPTDQSFREAIDFAVEGRFDGFVAIGGGSSIDTAKAANLYSTYPADFLTYVNPPIGAGTPVPGPLKPLIAIPTTAGTGSETTGTTIFDFVEMHAKTGIAHRALRPSLGIIDPDNTRSMPQMVAACSALDVLSHAVESLTAISFDQREAAQTPSHRPAYQGSNPISDIWAARAIEMMAASIDEAVFNPENEDARSDMLLAAAYAGIGFGNAGVHLPHGMSYPVSGMVRDYVPEGYPPDKPIIPHGMSVILNAPAVFRFTAVASPERHKWASGLLGYPLDTNDPEEIGEGLAQATIDIMKRVQMPNGLKAVGFTEDDVDDLVKGTLPQERVTKLSPRPASPDDLRNLFLDAMTYW
ncbi:MAG: iron-containing alcohol dehydrogenase [Sphaerobacteraceae bacterium]|nr:MAG: iron-containing alcohol dehydrogenase [Sphaerobacteraceae bacterium]